MRRSHNLIVARKRRSGRSAPDLQGGAGCANFQGARISLAAETDSSDESKTNMGNPTAIDVQTALADTAQKHLVNSFPHAILRS
jgi:hypothetical protein